MIEWDENEIELDHKLGTIRSGTDYDLEDIADGILAQYRREQGKDDDDPYEVLSPGQMLRRQSREVLNKNGVPEVHLYSGLFRRAYNPKMYDRPPREKPSNEEWG